MSAEQARELSEDELRRIPEIVKQMEDGEKQVKEYGEKLEQRHGNLRLQKFVVVALGFEKPFLIFSIIHLNKSNINMPAILYKVIASNILSGVYQT